MRLFHFSNLRQDALAQFGLVEAELTSDLRLTAAAVLRMQWSQHEEQPKLLLRVRQEEIESHQVGRGMGSPIPSLKEGAWTREGPKFVDGDHLGQVC